MTTPTVRSSHLTPLAVTTVIALIIGFLFVAPFLSVIALAALMAFLFSPIYHRLEKRTKKPRLSATITLITSGVTVLLPLTIILILTLAQLSTLSQATTAYISEHNTDIGSAVSSFVANVNNLVAPFNNHESVITDQGVRDFFATVIPAVVTTMTNIIIRVVGNIPTAVILTIMFIILFVEFLVHGKKIIGLIQTLSPFDHATTSLYLRRTGLMTNAMAKGQLIISLIISFLSAILMIMLGLGDYFFLFFVIFTILNLVPLGCGIILIPIAIIAILVGNVIPGVVVLALYMLVSNLDSIIRPKIMPREASLSAGLTMIAAFGGIAAFGLLGVVYGPIVMIFIVTTLQLYAEQKKKERASYTTP